MHTNQHVECLQFMPLLHGVNSIQFMSRE